MVSGISVLNNWLAELSLAISSFFKAKTWLLELAVGLMFVGLKL